MSTKYILFKPSRALMVRETTSEESKLKLAKARASRLKIVRKLTGCSTALEFSRKYNIPLPTIKAWESGTNTPLSTGGAYKVSELLKLDGIIVSADWLLTGAAPGPFTIERNTNDAEEPGKQGIGHFRDKLISSWASYNPSFFFTMTLDSDLYYPTYTSGDTILGYWLPPSKIEKLPKLKNISLLINVEGRAIQISKAIIIQNIIEYSSNGKLNRISIDDIKNSPTIKVGLIMATVNKLLDLPEE